MNNNSIYIKLNPPYTLDKWKDGGALTREYREFQVLENYIPVDGGIVVREGVLSNLTAPTGDTPVTNTPETTIPPFNPKTDARCYVVLDFEDFDNLGRNVATQEPDPQDIFLFPESEGAPLNGSATWSLAYKKEGSASLWISNNATENPAAGTGPNYYGLQRPGDVANMKTWCIGGEGSTTVDEWLVTGWFRQTANKTEAYIIQWGCVDNSTHTWTINNQTAVGNTIQTRVMWYDNTHALISNMSISGLTMNKWYFFGAWCSDNSHTSGLYIYDDDLKTDKFTSSVDAAFNYFYVTSSRKTIGGYAPSGGNNYIADSEAYPGQIDYITMWGVLPSSDADKLQLIKDVRDLHKIP